MTIALLASFEIKEGFAVQFEEAVKELSAQVLANEPGASMYQLCKSQTEPGGYRLIEVYADADALAGHGQSAHFKEMAPRLGACLAAKPVVEKYDFVAG